MIIRIKHNRENPYVTVNKKALWNKNLSLKAIGLWARCISRPDNWQFNVKELASSGLEGRRAIYSAIDELISENYALRLEHYEKAQDGKFTSGGVEYVFFEFAATQEEKDEEIEKFKKSFPQCGFGNRRDGDIRNVPLLSTKEEPSNEERINTDVQTEVRTSEAIFSSSEKKKNFSGIAYQRAIYFYNSLLKLHPKLKMPNLDEWAIELDRMQRIDKRTSDDIVGMIDWALEDSFWCSNILSPAALRRNFDKMNAKRFKPEVKGDYITKNRALSYELISDFKNKDKGKVMRVTDKELLRTDTHESIQFTEHPEKFTSEVCRIFSLKWSA